MSKRKRASGVTSAVGSPGLILPPVEGAAESITGEPSVEQSEPIQEAGHKITMYSPDGAPVEVDAASAPELYRQQKLGFAEGQKINVTRGGKVFEFTPDKLEAAFDNGYQIASHEQVETAKERKEFSGFGKTAEAFGHGVGRGLTFGLYDPLVVGAAGLVSPEAKEATRRELKLSKEHHPAASITGEVAGALAPIIASGGTAAVAEGGAEGAAHAAPSLLRRAISGVGFIPKGAAAAGEVAEHAVGSVIGHGSSSLLARTAQKAFATAAQAGVEGGIFGGGAVVSEATLGNEELNAEKIWAGIKHGFKLGAISGGVLGGGLELGKAAIDKGLKIAGKEGLEAYLNEIANNQTLKAAGVSTKDLKAMGKSVETIEARKGAIGEEIRNFRFENGRKLFSGSSTQRQLAEDLEKAVDEVGDKLGKFREKTARLAGEHNISADAEGFFQKFDTNILKPALDKGEKSLAYKRVMKVADEMDELRSRLTPPGLSPEHPLHDVWAAAEAGNPGAKTAMRSAIDQDPALAKLVQPQPVSIDDLTNLRKQFDDLLWGKRKGLGITPPPPEHLNELFDARQMLEQHIEQATDRIVDQTGNPEVVGAYKTLKDQYRNLADGRAIAAQAEVIRATARNTASLSDKMAAGSVLSGLLARGTIPTPTAMAYAGAAGLANKLVNEHANAALATIADKTAKLVALQTHVHHADHKVAEGINAFLGETHELHELAHKLGHVSREVGKTGLEVKEHVEHAAHKAAHGEHQELHELAGKLTDVGIEATGHVTEKVARGLARKEGAVEKAQQLVSDPHALATHAVALSSAIAEHAPKTALAVQDHAVKVAQNIANQAPRGHQPDDVLIPPPAPKASVAQRHRAATYAEVATKGPEVAVKAMKEGRLTPVHVQAIEENYPLWHQEMTQQMLDGVARNPKQSYEKRKQLGIFLKVPVDGTQTPRFKQSMQSIYQQQQQGAQQAPKPSRRPATKLASGQLTPSQKLNFE